MSELLVYQAVWGLEGLPQFDLSARFEAALDTVLAAGFDGVGIALRRREQSEIVSRVLAERGKSWEAGAAVASPDDLARALDRAQALGARHLNVQVTERPDRVADAVALLEAMERVAAGATIAVRYETHRGRLTNDLLFTVRVLDAMPQLKLTGDLSHYAMVHEMPLPVPPADLARMSRVIAQCCGYHGRVAGSHQVQVPLAAPQHQEWVEQFKAWWKEGFAGWLAGAAPSDKLSFMTELGPPNYAITGLDGRELSDRWGESLMLKDMARALWAEVAEPAPVGS